MGEHRHAEAFMLMKYSSTDRRTCEWVWNSRDGVTPFCIPPRAFEGPGTYDDMLSHVDWQRDEYRPHHRPQPGDRIFVDLTPEKAEYYARHRVGHGWDDPKYPMRDRFPSREEAVRQVAEEYLRQPVDLVEVAGGAAEEALRGLHDNVGTMLAELRSRTVGEVLAGKYPVAGTLDVVHESWEKAGALLQGGYRR